MRPREAARAAAEARNLNAGAESIIDRLARVDLFCPLSREIRPFQRLLDDQVSPLHSQIALNNEAE